jgi:hypothetical protein
MKKFMLALLVGMMVVGSTAAIAAAEITVGGTLETRYDLWYNLSMDNANLQRSQNFFAERILLNVDAKITEGLEAYVELDTSNGDVNATDERTWGAQSALGEDGAVVSATNHSGERMAIRQAWVNFMVPGIPVGVKIGHQPLALGHGIFLDSHRLGQDAILAYSKPIPELLIAGVYVKGLEQSNTNPQFGPSLDSHRDVDIYAVLANYTFMPNNTVGVFYLYGHDAANVGLALNGSFTLPPAATDLNNGVVGYLHNVGVIADGVIGPANYKFEVDYQDISAHAGGTNRVGANHSFAAMLGVGMNVMNMVNVGVEAAYGSGDNINKQNGVSFISTQGNFIGNQSYNNPYGTTSYNYAFLYNDKIGQGPLGTGGGLGLGDGTGGFGLANTSYIKLSASANPMAKLNVGMDVLYLRATGDHIVGLFEDGPAGFEKIGRSRDLGWEVDAHADYKIYDNLALNVTGGVFLPGQWYDDAIKFEGSGNEASTAYGVETKLTCKF